MSKRLEILKNSLIKKEQKFDDKLQNHIEGIEKTPCLGVKSGHGVNNLQGSLLYRGLSN